MYSCTDLELEVEIHMNTKEYMWIHDDTPRYTGYIQNTEKIRILTTIHAKYTKIRIEAKVSPLGGKTELLPYLPAPNTWVFCPPSVPLPKVS